MNARLALLMMIFGLQSCAMEVPRNPSQLTTSSAAQQLRTLEIVNEVSFTLSTGFQRTIKAGSKWDLVGSIPNGEVYKANNDIFTVEGANVHEAYLVLQSGYLVGFYFPVEQAFSPLEPKVSLTTR